MHQLKTLCYTQPLKPKYSKSCVSSWKFVVERATPFLWQRPLFIQHWLNKGANLSTTDTVSILQTIKNSRMLRSQLLLPSYANLSLLLQGCQIAGHQKLDPLSLHLNNAYKAVKSQMEISVRKFIFLISVRSSHELKPYNKSRDRYTIQLVYHRWIWKRWYE